MAHTVICPSGLKGEVRKLKVKEANMLADAAGIRRGTTIDEILRSVWLGCTDPGPYQPRPDGGLDWSKVLICDRFFTVVQVRIATYGPDYAFPVQCTAQTCREKFEWELDLNELDFKKVPDASIAKFAAGNRFETIIPSTGRRVTFKLQTGEDEAKAAKLARGRREEIMTMALAARIVEVDGVHNNDKLRFLDNLDMDDSVALIDQMDAADGGLETSVEVECPACGNVMEVAVPFGRDFWLPSKRRPHSTKATEQPSVASTGSFLPSTGTSSSGASSD